VSSGFSFFFLDLVGGVLQGVPIFLIFFFPFFFSLLSTDISLMTGTGWIGELLLVLDHVLL